jgi:F0F1-type ATP synthase assembly protein I
MASVQHLQQIFLSDIGNDNKYQRFYTCTTGLGLLVGVIIQLSTMFANCMIVSYLQSNNNNNNDSIDNDESDDIVSTRNIVIFSFCWSTLTSILAFVVLGCIRRYLGIEHHRLRHHVYDNDQNTAIKCNFINEESESEIDENDNDDDDSNTSDGYTASLVQVEHRFVAGAMIGVCLSWAITDVLLGLKKEVIYSVLTLVIALVWCQFVLKWTLANEKSKQQKQLTRPIMDHSYIAVV